MASSKSISTGSSKLTEPLNLSETLYVPMIIGNNYSIDEITIYSPNGHSFNRLSDEYNRFNFNPDVKFSNTFENNSSTHEISEDYIEHNVQRITDGKINYSKLENSLLPSGEIHNPVMQSSVRLEDEDVNLLIMEQSSDTLKLTHSNNVAVTKIFDFNAKYSNINTKTLSTTTETSIISSAKLNINISDGIVLNSIGGEGIPPIGKTYYLCIHGQNDGTGLIISSSLPCSDY